MGYKNELVTITAQKTVYNVQLKVDSQAVEEVVVVGYGTEKKVNLTGSVSSVSTVNKSKIDCPIPLLSNIQ